MSPPTVELEDWLEPLVPRFLTNRRHDVVALRAAIAAGDLAALRFMGHKLRGAAAGYGFAVIAEIGARLEALAEGGDLAAAAACLAELEHHLATLKVVYRPAGA